jgi:hypothetical protein
MRNRQRAKINEIDEHQRLTRNRIHAWRVILTTPVAVSAGCEDRPIVYVKKGSYELKQKGQARAWP